MNADIESMTRAQQQILIRLVTLIQVPREYWSDEDHRFYKDIRESLQRSTNDQEDQRAREHFRPAFQFSGR